MRDPHVTRLHFMISSGESTAYENPEPLIFERPFGRFEARDGRLTVEPAAHFSDQESALMAIAPFLRAWEIETDLIANPETIRFKFVDADLIDRDPLTLPPGSVVAYAKGVGALAGVGTVRARVIYRKYPAPPRAFEATPDVSSAHQRWLGYRARREPLQAMGYFVLTLVEAAAVRLTPTEAKGRKKPQRRDAAAKFFRIDSEVLDKLGELTTARGDPATARKAPMDGHFQELTGAEPAWLEQAIRVVVKRLGERASGAILEQLTMNDLPGL